MRSDCWERRYGRTRSDPRRAHRLRLRRPRVPRSADLGDPRTGARPSSAHARATPCGRPIPASSWSPIRSPPCAIPKSTWSSSRHPTTPMPHWPRRRSDAGKHVVVDKPFTVTLAQARALAARAAEDGRVLSVFQNRRWDSDFLGISREIAGGLDRRGRGAEVRDEPVPTRGSGPLARARRPGVRALVRSRSPSDRPGPRPVRGSGEHHRRPSSAARGRIGRRLVSRRCSDMAGRGSSWLPACSRPTLPLGSSYAARRAVSPSGVAIHRKASSSRAWSPVPPPGATTRIRSSSPTATSERRLRWPPRRATIPAYYAAIRDAIGGDGPVPVTPAQATTLMAVIEAGIRSSVDGRVVRPEYTADERSSWSPAVHSIPRGPSEPG